ncbi:MAG: cysteine desulfurase family protein [Candidatus Saccharibacteria bacterium]|nr:cysteine desulfurase family protein [Candidatus Saccharibacteria bacterium]
MDNCQTEIYLDNAAATPVDDRVLRVMMPYFSDDFYNPSAAYLAARQVRSDVETARHQLAQLIGAKTAEIVITAGATESINIALNGIAGRIVTTAIEHQSVLVMAQQRGGVILPVNNKGLIDLVQLRQALTDEVTLVSVGYINSEIGVVQDISAIAGVINEVRADRRQRGIEQPLYLHTDASQAAGLLDLNVARLGVDLMTLNAGKCYGPKQVGLLYVRAGVRVKPLIVGGGQEMGLRSGTENVTGIIGFAKALQLAEKTRGSEVKRLTALRNQLKTYLVDNLPDVKINEHPKRNSPAILNFSAPNVDGERVVFALDERGVMVATGSACAANKGLRSHVLTALGLPDNEVDGSIRVSFGRFTTEEDIERASRLIVEVINDQRRFGALSVA